MEFYELLSKYYDQIFKVGDEKIKFIEQFYDRRAKILDLGCGTGNLALPLAQDNYKVIASDISSDMIEQLKKKDINNLVRSFVGDMRNLQQDINAPLDGIICIGNTLSHLKKEEIPEVLEQMKEKIKKTGKIIIQIVNNENWISEGKKVFNDILLEKEEIVFRRVYKYDSKIDRIQFESELYFPEKRESVKSSIFLYAIRKDWLIENLQNTGFHSIKLYGDFKGNPYEEKSSALIVVAES